MQQRKLNHDEKIKSMVNSHEKEMQKLDIEINNLNNNHKERTQENEQ